MATTTMAEAERPSWPLYGWGAVLVLFLAYAVAFLDRGVMGLLVEPLRRDLKITDTQFGLLAGPAFGLFYVTAGLPLGWLADRTNRVYIIAIGILLWSAMSVASGLSTNFAELFIARMGVGVGEAALAPAAVSLLADLFPPERRAMPLGTFTAGNALGSGLALILGGIFIAYAAHGIGGLPLVGSWFAARHPWQDVFILTGLLGVPVALAVLMLREPPRARTPIAGDTSSLGDGISYIRTYWYVLLPILVGTGVMFLSSNAAGAWSPAMWIRKFHWTATEVGTRLGAVTAPCSVLGFLASGLVAGWLARRGRIDAPLLTMIIGATIYTPASILTPLMPTPALTIACVMIGGLSGGLTFGMATTAIVSVTPSRLRGLMVSVYLLIGNLVGQGLGPPSVGVLMDYVLGGPTKVSIALSIVSFMGLAPGLLLLLAATWRYWPRAVAIKDADAAAA